MGAYLDCKINNYLSHDQHVERADSEKYMLSGVLMRKYHRQLRKLSVALVEIRNWWDSGTRKLCRFGFYARGDE